jgi:hypothetical protein
MYAIPQDPNRRQQMLKPRSFSFLGLWLLIGHFVNVPLVLFVGQQNKSEEYEAAVEQLKPQLGSVMSVRVARIAQAIKVFVKRQPNAFPSWPYAHLCKANDYATKFHLPVHKTITKNVKDFLLWQQVITQEQYDA